MIDISSLLTMLKVNGLSEVSTVAEVESILDSLKFSPVDKEKAFEILRTSGWKLDGVVSSVPEIVQNPLSSNQIPSFSNYAVPVADSPVKRFNYKVLFVVVFVCIFIFGFAFAGYFIYKGNFFVKSVPYTESLFFSKLLLKSSDINSASYKASLALDIAKRDSGAIPFISNLSEDSTQKQQYLNDYKRAQSVSAILRTLYLKKKPLPNSLNSILSDIKNFKEGTDANDISIFDPVTKVVYEYKTTNNGNNFALSVVFETSDAVNTIKNAGQPGTVVVSGKKVTFTDQSSMWLYVPKEAPKPIMVQIAESLEGVPENLRILGAVSASSERKSGTLADWIFNINFEVVYDVFNIKVNLEALKKGLSYYVRVNDMPDFFGEEVTLFENQWVQISQNDTTSSEPFGSNSSDASSFSKEIFEYEKTYKEGREKFVRILSKLALIADDSKLIAFKESPTESIVDGRTLTQYKIQIKKEALLDFYTQIDKEVDSNPDFKDLNKTLNDYETREYFDSKEFAELFDYFDKNSQISFWTDEKGFPALFEYSIRVVPPDTALRLKDKQANLVFKIALSDINKSVKIEAPNNTVMLDTILKQLFNMEKETPVLVVPEIK